MVPSGRITHVIGYIEYIGYIALFGTGICRFCIWVELPVQRRLCPIFVRNVGSSDIHKCFRGLTSSQRTPGIGVSQHIQYHCPGLSSYALIAVNKSNKIHNVIKKRLTSKLKQVYPLFRPRNSILLKCILR